MLRKDIPNDVVKHTLIKYLDKTAEYTPDKRSLEILKKATLWGRSNSLNFPLLRQAYDEFGFEDEATSIYGNFIKLIEKHHSIDRNVVEIGGGPIPRLAFRIASKQTKGKVTVYDPLMHPTNYNLENLIIKRERFTMDTPVEKDSLIIGFMPCGGTETLIKYATKNKHDFMVALCGCIPESNYYSDEDDDYYYWVGHMEYYASVGIKDNDLGVLGKESLKEFDDPYPILYNDRKGKKKILLNNVK